MSQKMYEDCLAVQEGMINSFSDIYSKEVSNFDDVINKYPKMYQMYLIKAIDLISQITDYDFKNDRHFRIEDVVVFKNYNKITEVYEQIQNAAQYLEEQRRFERSGRSRWQGGGFGISGAIKGAVMAGAMNMATNAVRGIGDSAANAKDRYLIEQKKREFYESVDIFKLLAEDLFDSCERIIDYVFE